VGSGADPDRHGAKRIHADVRGGLCGAAKAGAPVSAPCTWEELERGEVGPQKFTLRMMAGRVAKGWGSCGGRWSGQAVAAGRWNVAGDVKFNARGASRRRRCLSRPWFDAGFCESEIANQSMSDIGQVPNGNRVRSSGRRSYCCRRAGGRRMAAVAVNVHLDMGTLSPASRWKYSMPRWHDPRSPDRAGDEAEHAARNRRGGADCGRGCGTG